MVVVLPNGALGFSCPSHPESILFMTLQPVKCLPGSSNYNNQTELPPDPRPYADAVADLIRKLYRVSLHFRTKARLGVRVASISHREPVELAMETAKSSPVYLLASRK